MVGFYSKVMHSVKILTDDGGETLEFLHFMNKNIQSFQGLEVQKQDEQLMELGFCVFNCLKMGRQV